MRFIALATAAALAALTIASAPAHAQGKAEAIQRYCPDLTFNQIGTGLAQLVEQYEFSTDADEASMQAASLLCGYGDDVAEADAEEKKGVVQAVLPPSPGPYFNGPKPHFRGPHPRFARPTLKRPPGYRPPPPPPPYYGQRPVPPRYGRPLVQPPMAGAGAYGRQAYGGGMVSQQRSFHRETTQFCETEQQADPPPQTVPGTNIPYAYCEWVQHPKKPCPAWHCSTIAKAGS